MRSVQGVLLNPSPSRCVQAIWLWVPWSLLLAGASADKACGATLWVPLGGNILPGAPTTWEDSAPGGQEGAGWGWGGGLTGVASTQQPQLHIEGYFHPSRCSVINLSAPTWAKRPSAESPPPPRGPSPLLPALIQILAPELHCPPPSSGPSLWGSGPR